jgi:hypothetical protein
VELGKSVGKFLWGIAFDATRVFYSDYYDVVVLDTSTLQTINTIEIGSAMNDVTVCENGRTLLVACEDQTARVVDLRTKNSLILKDQPGHISCIVECGDRDVLTCSMDGSICRWNRLTGECIRFYSGHSDAVNCILLNWEMKVMFSGSNDEKIIVWNVETGEQIGAMKEHSHSVLSLAFVNATTIVSGSADKTVRIWDITAKKEIIRMSSHKGSVHSVAVTPDRQHVISGSDDKTVKVWSIATGECITTLSHHSSFVVKVAVSPDGRFIASGGQDNIFHLVSVTPPFSCIVCQGLLTPSAADHCLFSNGRLLQGDIAVCNITPSTSCSLTTETQFTLKNHAMPSGSEHNNNKNNCVSLCALSAVSARQWVEAIDAVRHTLSLHPNQRSNTSQKILSRYRFDLLQIISIVNKRSNNWVLIPKDVMQIIGNYIICV